MPGVIPPGRSAIMAAQALWGGHTYQRESDVSVGVTQVTLAPNNPNRIELILTNWGQSPVAWSWSQQLTPTTGMPLAPNGGFAVLTIIEDGEPVVYQVYALATGAGNSVHVTEILLV